MKYVFVILTLIFSLSVYANNKQFEVDFDGKKDVIKEANPLHFKITGKTFALATETGLNLYIDGEKQAVSDVKPRSYEVADGTLAFVTDALYFHVNGETNMISGRTGSYQVAKDTLVYRTPDEASETLFIVMNGEKTSIPRVSNYQIAEKTIAYTSGVLYVNENGETTLLGGRAESYKVAKNTVAFLDGGLFLYANKATELVFNRIPDTYKVVENGVYYVSRGLHFYDANTKETTTIHNFNPGLYKISDRQVVFNEKEGIGLYLFKDGEVTTITNSTTNAIQFDGGIVTFKKNNALYIFQNNETTLLSEKINKVKTTNNTVVFTEGKTTVLKAYYNDHIVTIAEGVTTWDSGDGFVAHISKIKE